MKQRCRIIDSAFAHVSCSANGSESQYIEWDRESPIGPNTTLFLTDMNLPKVSLFNCKKNIAWLLESPAVIPQVYDWINYNSDRFDYVFTHRKDWCEQYPEKFKWTPVSAIWTPKEECGVHPKSKLLSAIISDKKWFEGHRFRHLCAKTFKDKIDLFGTGFNKPIKTKAPALNDYMFNLAILNYRSPLYQTDIIGDCWANGVIPIYHGGQLPDFINPDGVLEFETIDELGGIISTLSKELYESKLEAVKENFLAVEKIRVGEDYAFEHYPEVFQ